MALRKRGHGANGHLPAQVPDPLLGSKHTPRALDDFRRRAVMVSVQHVVHVPPGVPAAPRRLDAACHVPFPPPQQAQAHFRACDFAPHNALDLDGCPAALDLPHEFLAGAAPALKPPR